MTGSKEIRQSFIRFFEERDHRFQRSAPVVPIDDPTLLFTNAGMNQFKAIFLGQEEASYPRAVNSQKCIRVSGKHNDLEEVGLDTFHHTFFEMLGNWSFGDYYKAEAIQWAWELFTAVWGLDKERLWATVYQDDEDSFRLWTQVTDIDPGRVLRFGAKENFWEMGDTGPCGPCSEIHYYVGSDPSRQSPEEINQSNLYWELWNLVFIQNNRTADGSLEDLPARHVDTGAGLERIVTVLQSKDNNYETDLFLPLIERIETLTGVPKEDNPVPHQVIADHIRMLTFSIADGGMPSNDGRGYVLRRILRRAARFGRLLDQHEPFIYQLVDTVGEIMGSVYPEVHEKKAHIQNVLQAEEASFNETLDRGLFHLEKLVSSLAGTTIPGEEAFRLYDTYGFPLDLTQLLGRERGLDVDLAGFQKAMEAQRARAKAAAGFEAPSSGLEWITVQPGKDSTFLGYKTLVTQARIRRYARHDENWLLVLDQTPFYAQAGGQVGDTGWIGGEGVELQVVDVRSEGSTWIHTCRGSFDVARASQPVECRVDEPRRQRIRKNHTATHLLQAALKQVLGEHVQQAGSLVHPDYLRFDLTHFEKISPDQVHQVEDIVNREILLNTELEVSHTPYEEARRQGAVALFGEKYGEEVRVINIGSFSIELCGGTHVDRTGDIGLFKITAESALAAGIRRLMAVTGPMALEYVQNQAAILEELQQVLQCAPEQLTSRVDQLIKQRKDLEKELHRKQQTTSGSLVKALLEKGQMVDGRTIVIDRVEASSLEGLKSLGDQLLAGLESGVGVLGAEFEKKPGLVVVVSPDLVEAGLKAGNLARSIGSLLGGSGGGRPHLATAGGKQVERLPAALEESLGLIKTALQDL